jgi:colicin import membrane protein
MKDIKYAYAYRYQGSRNDSRLVALSFGISIFIHMIFIGTLIFLPESTPRSRFSSGVVNVSLVSMPGKQPEAGTATQVVAKPKKEAKKPPKAKISKIIPPPQKPVVAPPKPKNAISLAPKPKKKTSMKKKTFNRPKIIESAIKQVKEKVDDSESSSVKEAINRLKKQVKETEEARPQTPQVGGSKGGAGGIGSGQGSGGGVGPRTLEAIKIFQAEIQYQIQKNWAFPPQLAGNNFELEAMLGIKIMRNGEIEDIWFDKKSGNHNLDESAYKAILKSNPLPPLPNDYIGSSYTVGLRFGPKGLK